MEVVATQKFIRMSPKKLRVVADMVRKLTPVRAVEVLPLTSKRASGPIVKVIKTAIANAKNKGLSPNDLAIKEIQINEGPRLKRGRPVSRGVWHPFKRRTSHIRVVLTSVEPVAIKQAKKDILEKKTEIVEEREAKVKKPLINLKLRKAGNKSGKSK